MVDKASQDVFFKQIIELNDSLTPTQKLDVDEGLKVLRHSFDLLEKAIEPIYAFTPCKKGCSACCNLTIDMTEIEAELIKKYVKENFTSEDIKYLENRFNDDSYHCPNTQHCLNDESLRLEYFKLNRPCAFLSKNGECIFRTHPDTDSGIIRTAFR